MANLFIVHHPVETVFDFIANHENDVYWKPFVIESRKITDGKIGKGTRFEVIAETRGKRVCSIIEVLNYEPHRFYAYKSYAQPLPFVATLTFSAVSNHTRIDGKV